MWIGNTLPPCPIEKCSIILVSLSLSRTGICHGLVLLVIVSFVKCYFFFCSQKVKANLSDDNVYEFLNLEERRYFELSFYDKNDNLVSASLFL